MSTLRVYVEGIGLWSPHLADFAALGAVLAGAKPVLSTARPSATMLPANERRRAPESALLAAEVAGQAVLMSGRAAATLPCVWASAFGDQATTDYMCAALAHNPADLSPTRFHNSVHNAPVGYWTIAIGCHAASTAVAAERASFGAGLLEAACQVLAEQEAVLLVCSDVAGPLPLLEATHCSESFGCAFVLAPERSAQTLAHLDLQLTPACAETPLNEPLATWRENNASACALALLARLARKTGSCQLAAAPTLGLHIDMENVA